MAGFRISHATTSALRGLRRVTARPEWFSQVTPATLRHDLVAGLTGATIVLPQAVAFAAIAGLPPQYGFYTAIVVPVIAALLGSSLHAVSGPTTAISVLVFSALSETFAPGSAGFISAAITLALFVGCFQVILGVARLGGLVDFVSHSVMIGFVTAAALVIAIGQLSDAMAVDVPPLAAPAVHLEELGAAVGSIDTISLSIALVALITGIVVKRYLPSWPNYLIALVLASGYYLALGEIAANVKTVGVIPSVFPSFEMPLIAAADLSGLVPTAFAISLVGLLEAISVARGIALRSGQKIDNNREFVAQGASNIAGSFFQCYPGSASFTRSGVNYDAGARTPMSAIFAAALLLLLMIFLMPLFAFVPIPAIAGIIILVAWKLVGFAELRYIFRTSRSESWIVIVTVTSGLFVSLEFSIYAGVLLSFLLFLNWTAHPQIGVAAPDPSLPSRTFRNAHRNGLTECPQLMIVRLHGPLYFGSVEFLRRYFSELETDRPNQKHVLFIVAGSAEVDLSGANLLKDLTLRFKSRGGRFHLLTKTPRSIRLLIRYGVVEAIGRNRLHTSKGTAIQKIVPTLERHICDACTARIFFDCPPRSVDEQGS